MKTYKTIALPILFLIFFTVESCRKSNCPIPTSSLVSQYDLNKSIAAINTTNVATGFETVFSKTIFDSASRAQFSQSFVAAARFYEDESGYFFIETLNGAWMVAHINTDLIGTQRYNISDINGKYFIREMVEVVRYTGYGFVEYYRKNPISGAIERKLSFVTSIPSAQWFIGSGFYGGPTYKYYEPIDANKLIIKEVTNTLSSGFSGVFQNFYTQPDDRILFCRDFVDHIRFFDDGSGYFFINDLNGINIANGEDAEHQGQNDYDLKDTHGTYIIRDMIDIVKTKGSGYYEYYWTNPASGKEEVKIVYVVRIPNTEYFIGSGFYKN